MCSFSCSPCGCTNCRCGQMDGHPKMKIQLITHVGVVLILAHEFSLDFEIETAQDPIYITTLTAPARRWQRSLERCAPSLSLQSTVAFGGCAGGDHLCGVSCPACFRAQIANSVYHCKNDGSCDVYRVGGCLCRGCRYMCVLCVCDWCIYTCVGCTVYLCVH